MNVDQMVLVYGALGILGGGQIILATAIVWLLSRLDRYATIRELALANDRLDHMHTSFNDLRNHVNDKRGER